MKTQLIIPGFRILKVEPRNQDKLTILLCEALPGGAADESELRLFPGNRGVSIRSKSEGDGSYRLRIKGVRRADLSEGMVLVSHLWPVTESREGLFLHDGESIPAESEAFRGGFCPDFNRERILPRGTLKRQGAFITVHFPVPFPLLPGADYSILGSDGKPRSFTLLWPRIPTQDQFRQLNAMAPRRPDPHPDPEEIYGRILHVQGFVKIPPTFGKDLWDSAVRVYDWVLEKRRWEVLRRRLTRIASRPGGADTSLLVIEDYPVELLLDLARWMVAQGELSERGSWYFPPGPPRLSPFHRGWLDRVQKAGEEGLRVGSLKNNAEKDALDVLVRTGLVRGGIGIWLSEEAYRTLADSLLEGCKSGDVLSMADARAILSGSRVRTLEVLALMESDGRLIPGRDGNVRTVT